MRARAHSSSREAPAGPTKRETPRRPSGRWAPPPPSRRGPLPASWSAREPLGRLGRRSALLGGPRPPRSSGLRRGGLRAASRAFFQPRVPAGPTKREASESAADTGRGPHSRGKWVCSAPRSRRASAPASAPRRPEGIADARDARTRCLARCFQARRPISHCSDSSSRLRAPDRQSDALRVRVRSHAPTPCHPPSCSLSPAQAAPRARAPRRARAACVSSPLPLLRLGRRPPVPSAGRAEHTTLAPLRPPSFHAGCR